MAIKAKELSSLEALGLKRADEIRQHRLLDINRLKYVNVLHQKDLFSLVDLLVYLLSSISYKSSLV
jgi:hypothetical protein